MRLLSVRCMLLFFVWATIYATHAFLGYYHDDYAYAGLTYFYNVGGSYEERFTFLKYITYLYEHYMGWGGRIIAFGIAIPFMHAGPSIFWFVQSLLVTGMLCLGASIATQFTEKQDFSRALLFLFASYLSMKILLVRDGLYWGAASVLYVWPMFFLLLGIFLMKDPENKKKRLFAALFLFIASASSEPFSLYALSFVGVRLLLDLVKKREYVFCNLGWLLAAVSGFLFCFLAPGNFKRALFVPGQKIPPLAELIGNIPDAFNWLELFFPKLYSMSFFYFALFALGFYIVQIWVFREKKFWHILPFGVACCAVVCLFLLPAARSPRVFMPLILTLPIFAAPCFVILLKKIPWKTIQILCLIWILWYGLRNYIRIWNGYKQNYSTIIENDATLSAYTPGMQHIVLKKLPDGLYANSMPYDKGTDYILVFMKQYYDIPEKVLLIFKEAR